MSNMRKIKAAHAAFTEAYQCGHCNAAFSDGPQGRGVYHEPTCPAFTGAADAGASGRRAAADASEQTGFPVIHDSLIAGEKAGPHRQSLQGPRTASIVWIYDERAVALARCRHLPKGSLGDEPAFWVAWDPGMLRCFACIAANLQRLNGTDEDATCDYCRRHIPLAPDGEPLISPVHVLRDPVMLTLGLCPDCTAADEADLAGTP